MNDPAMSGVWPGRRLSIKDVAFDGFPADGGLWWLRWMDYGAATTTSRSSLWPMRMMRTGVRETSRLVSGGKAEESPGSWSSVGCRKGITVFTPPILPRSESVG